MRNLYQGNFDELEFPSSIPEELIEESKEILVTGNPLEYLLKTFHNDHIADDFGARALIYTLVCSSIENSEGLHTLLTGSSGAGKSDCVRVILSHLPEKYKINGSLSDKYLYYGGSQGTIKSGMILYLDEADLTRDFEATLKISVSQWNIPTKHYTLTNQQPKELSIPPRLGWIITRVDQPGDDQIMNRFINVWIDESENVKEQTTKKILGAYKNYQEKVVRKDRPEISVCKGIWSILKGHNVTIEIPYVNHLIARDHNNPRNTKRFIGMILANAALNMFQREQIGITVDGSPIILATKEDYDEASFLFNQLYQSGGQKYNLVRDQATVVELLLKDYVGNGYVTMNEISTLSNKDGNFLSYSKVRRALKGRRENDGRSTEGLIDICPAIRYIGKKSARFMGTSNNQDIFYVDVNSLSNWYESRAPFTIDPNYEWPTSPLNHDFPTTLPMSGNVESPQFEEIVE